MAIDGDLRKLDVNFIAALALHSHRRDLALFHRSYVSIKTRGLLWYYGRLRGEAAREFFRMAANIGITSAAKQRMAKIMTEAETATPERLRELLAEAQKLQAKVEQLTGLSGEVTDG